MSRSACCTPLTSGRVLDAQGRAIRFFVGRRLIIRLVIHSFLLPAPQAVWIDGPPNVSRPDPNRSVQFDAKHPARNRTIEGSDPAGSSHHPAVDLSKCLIIPLIIPTIRRAPSRSDGIDNVPNAERDRPAAVRVIGQRATAAPGHPSQPVRYRGS